MNFIELILIGIIILWLIIAIRKLKKNKCIGCDNEQCPYKNKPC